jgi:hypothetical protein
MDAYVLAISVKDSQYLPTRAKNVLKRLGCETIEDVVKLTPEQILRSKWAGKKVLAYIKLWLDSFGLSLSDSSLTMPTSAGFPLLNGYLQFRGRIYDYFGYSGPDFPIEDCTNRPWGVNSARPERLATIAAWTYRGKDFTLIVSKASEHQSVLCIYDNAKEFKSNAAIGGE